MAYGQADLICLFTSQLLLLNGLIVPLQFHLLPFKHAVSLFFFQSGYMLALSTSPVHFAQRYQFNHNQGHYVDEDAQNRDYDQKLGCLVLNQRVVHIRRE